MWLITGKSPFLCKQQALSLVLSHVCMCAAGRDSMTGVGMIDSFFDNWLPIFVHECRRLTHLDNQMIVHNKSLEEALPVRCIYSAVMRDDLVFPFPFYL